MMVMEKVAEAGAGGEALASKRPPLRTRTGCLTCRQRRKKCDEKKPQCSGCARNFLDCIWPTKSANIGASSASPEATQFDFNGAGNTTNIIVPSRSRQSSKSPARCAVRNGNKHGKNQQELECLIRWIPRMTAFVGAERAAWLTPYSGNLLQHYLQNTSTFLTSMPLSYNPFVNIIMPLSYSDDLLMHSVLALSGTHLSFERSNDIEVQLAAHQHYQLILKSLRVSLTNPDFENDVSQLVRLVLILVVVCHVEVRRHLSFPL